MAYSRWSSHAKSSAGTARPRAEPLRGPPASGHASEDEEDEEDDGTANPVHPYPANQRSLWLPPEAWKLARASAGAAAEELRYCALPVPPEAPFCWTAADYSIYSQSSASIRPKLRLEYYMSPQCPQTIVDLVAPILKALNWICTVSPPRSPADPPPILIWEGSQKPIDPAPTLARRGLVNRVAPVFRITTKCGMLQALQARCRANQTAFPPPWYPQAFRLPEELAAWKEHAEAHPEKRWIYKPNGGARGIGIMLISGVEDVDTPEEPFSSRCRAMGPFNPDEPPLAQRHFAPSGVIQEYVQDLLLINGRKFAVRVYVLIARVQPLLVYLHRASYAKVCGLPFDSNCFSQAELFRHVTNQEFQKKGGQAYAEWKTIPVMTLDEVDALLAKERSQAGEQASEPWSAGFWPQVRRICVGVMDSVRGRLQAKGKPGMFEILGLDFICNADGRVIFLEANRDPSWVVDGDTKRGIIPALVAEMLTIVLSSNGELLADQEALRVRSDYHFETIIDDEHDFVAT